jgi:hypothetical protein
MSKGLKQYREVTLSSGEVVKVYRVPTAVLSGIIPRPRPRRPSVEMKLATGQTQSRPIKAGDPGWEEYQEELEQWEADRAQLQRDVSLVLALSDVEIPEGCPLPPAIQQLVDSGLLPLPDNPYSRQALWLRTHVVSFTDELELDLVQQELNGVPEEVIEQIKENFRNYLLREAPEAVGSRAQEK